MRFTAGQVRVGLQTKAICLLVLLVVAVTGSGAWFYYDTAQSLLQQSDQRHARQICEALALAAQDAADHADNVGLQRLIADFVRSYHVRYAAVFSADERTMAASVPNTQRTPWRDLLAGSLVLSDVRQVTPDTLTACIPMVRRRPDGSPGQLIGSVRVVLDTGDTQKRLVKTRQRILVLGCSIALLSIPLALLVVRRTFLAPVGRLVRASRALARGDFATRCQIRSRDEIGQLGLAFDAMASQLAANRADLLAANDDLERKIALRTDQLQLANLRLREEMTEKEDFLRAVSHDLNAPLRNIAGMATLILTKWHDQLPEDAVARLGRIQANVEVQSSLITELMELSRIRTRPEKRSLVDLNALAADVAAGFEYELQARGIELVIRPLPTLCVEGNRIRQVFQNLIDNAIKYMDRPSGGRIEIGDRPGEGMHRLYVSDNGPGIPLDLQHRIFTVFRRGNNPGVPGRGVGLSLVKSVAANHEGRAYVQSEPGQGATFYVELPEQSTSVPAREEVAV